MAQQIASNDHTVNVVSTAPSEKGQSVKLYLRERIKGTPDPNKLVLFIHGAGTPPKSASTFLTPITAGWPIWPMPDTTSSRWIWKAMAVPPAPGDERQMQPQRHAAR